MNTGNSAVLGNYPWAGDFVRPPLDGFTFSVTRGTCRKLPAAATKPVGVLERTYNARIILVNGRRELAVLRLRLFDYVRPDNFSRAGRLHPHPRILAGGIATRANYPHVNSCYQGNTWPSKFRNMPLCAGVRLAISSIIAATATGGGVSSITPARINLTIWA